MLGGLAQGQRGSTVAGQVPAPVLGINVLNSLAQMNPAECIYTFNMVSQDGGVRVRDGYAEWANGWVGDAGTIIPFNGFDPANDKLFVATSDGIYDCTSRGETAPTKVQNFTSSAGLAGYGVYTQMMSLGEEAFLFYADGENGLYRYEEVADVWIQVTSGAGAGQMTGVTPETVNYVTVWKNQLVMIQRDRATAYALPARTLSGAANQVVIGTQFKQGGSLKAAYNWTLDGGVGVDDYLVFVSSEGDVVIYQGSGFEAQDFALVGVWNIGRMPFGNRFGVEFGGELYLASSYGVVPVSYLLNGANVADPMTYLSRKVGPYLRNIVEEVLDERGWQLFVDPKDSLLYLSTPPRASFEQIDFVMYFADQAWSMSRALNRGHSAVWEGEVYWLDRDVPKLFIEEGTVDGVYLDPATDGDPVPIEWDLLTSYNDLGQPAYIKRCHFIRPNFLSELAPSYSAEARYDYDVAENTSGIVQVVNDVGIWGTGVWGEAVFGGGATPTSKTGGAGGMGYRVAIAMRGSTIGDTRIIGFDVMSDQGGMF